MSPSDIPPAADRIRSKKAVGERVAHMVESGMRLGLGTGSTAAEAIASLGRRIRSENLDLCGVPTSYSAEQLARTHGIRVATLDDVEGIDLAFDGADEVDPIANLIKGRGGAQTREKVIAAAADRFVVLVDESKLVDRLGTRMPLPVEVLPFAVAPVLRHLKSLGASPIVRQAVGKDGPVITDQGFWIIDARFESIEDPAALNRILDATPGILDHGLFIGLATDVLVGLDDGSVDHRSFWTDKE
jgi:ribose 5-phosphate isomerase A